MDQLLLRGEYARLWWGSLVNQIGTWMTTAALPVYVYVTTNSVPAASAMFLAATLPGVLLGGVGGVVADRFDRRSVLIVTNLLAALSLAPLLFVSSQGLWVVYLSALLKAVVTLPAGPARAALLPALVPPGELARANALTALGGNVARLAGPALGGAAYAAWGLGTVVVLDAVTYVVAAAFIASVAARPVVGAGAAAQGWARAWRGGWTVVRNSKALMTLVGLVAVTSVGEGIFGVLLAPFVTSVIGGDARVFGWILSAQAVGGVLGGVVVARGGARVSPALLLGLGSVGLGLADLAIFLYPLAWTAAWPALALMVLAGLPASASGAGWTTLTQRFADDEVRGRVFGLAGQLAGLGVLLGVGLASLARGPASIVLLLCLHPLLLVSTGAAALLLARAGLFGAWTARRTEAAT